MERFRIRPGIQSLFDAAAVIGNAEHEITRPELQAVDELLIQEALFRVKEYLRHPEFLGTGADGGIDVKVEFGLELEDSFNARIQGQIQACRKTGIFEIDLDQAEGVEFQDGSILRTKSQVRLDKHLCALGVDLQMEYSAHAEELGIAVFDRRNLELEGPGQ